MAACCMTDPDDVDAIALDFAERRLAQLAEQLADASYVDVEVLAWWVAVVRHRGIEVACLPSTWLAIYRRVISDLVAAL